MRHVPYSMKKLLVTAFAGMLLLAGCSAGDSSSDSGAPAAPARDQPAGGAVGAAGDKATDGDMEQAAPEGVEATGGPVEGRSMVYRGDVTVRVEKVEEMAARVAALAGTAGGFVGSEKRSADGADAQASITVRVPSKQFQSVLEQIAALGDELSRGTNTEDVTEAVVDLDTRIAAAKASVTSVRTMFTQAKQLSELVLLERELNQREAALASLEAKKRRLDDLVSLSTIQVSLVGPHVEVVEPKKEAPGFLGGLEAGWNTFVVTVQVALAVLGFLLPFLIALGIPLTALVLWRRRRNPPMARVAPAAPPAGPPVPPAAE